MNQISKYLQSFFSYLRLKVTRVQFIMVIATLTGIISGLMAVLLKSIVHHIQEFVESTTLGTFTYLIFPAIGLVLTNIIIIRFYGGFIERGIGMVLKSIAKWSSFIPFKHTYLHVITSSITVGFGGSVGLEAPIVATGSSIGSNISRIADLNYHERTLLIACGASAGISAVFNAPITGVIFAIEILLTDTIISYFIPLMISSVIGALCSKIILNEDSLFNFVLKQNFDYNNIPFYIGLGVLCGFISLYYAKLFKTTEIALHQWEIPQLIKGAIGGIFLMAIYFVLPPLFGEGYLSVKLVANNTFDSFSDNTSLFSYIVNEWGIIIFSFLIVMFKPIAAGITIGSGGNGGNFAPSLFTGSFLGFFYSKTINAFQYFHIPVGNFSLVGMAGLLSGVMYCPLTAIFLIAEITNGYELFIPLMIVSSISFFIVKSYEPFSMDIKKLAQEGQILTHHKEKNILSAISLDSMLQDKYDTISIDKNLGDLVQLIKQSNKNIFAVIDRKDKFVGIIEINDVKQKIFQLDKFRTTPIRVVYKKPFATIQIDEKMNVVMEKFDISNSWYLPVLDKDKKFIGFISKTKLFNKYREILSSHTDIYDEE